MLWLHTIHVCACMYSTYIYMYLVVLMKLASQRFWFHRSLWQLTAAFFSGGLYVCTHVQNVRWNQNLWLATFVRTTSDVRMYIGTCMLTLSTSSVSRCTLSLSRIHILVLVLVLPLPQLATWPPSRGWASRRQQDWWPRWQRGHQPHLPSCMAPSVQ